PRGGHERSGQVADARASGPDEQEVEANLRVAEVGTRAEERRRGPDDAISLGGGERLLEGVRPAAALDLADRHDPAPLGHEVDFAPAAPPVPRDEPPAAADQVTGRRLLAVASAEPLRAHGRSLAGVAVTPPAQRVPGM